MWEPLDALGGAKLFERMNIADRGWVDAGRLARMGGKGLLDYRSGDDPSGAWAVWSAYAIETWVRQLAPPRTLATPPLDQGT
jgi:hypothetical protein